MIHVPFSELVVGEEFEIHYPGFYVMARKVDRNTYYNYTICCNAHWSGGTNCWVWPHQHEHAIQAASQTV